MDLVNRERADLQREAKEALPTAAMEAITLTLENPARAVHRRVARRDMAAIHLSAIHMATVEESPASLAPALITTTEHPLPRAPRGNK